MAIWTRDLLKKDNSTHQYGCRKRITQAVESATIKPIMNPPTPMPAPKLSFPENKQLSNN